MTIQQEPPGLQIANLKLWLSQNVPGYSDVTDFSTTLLAGGRSNISYLIQAKSAPSIVLRRPPLGHVMPTAHDMSREFRVLSGLNQAKFPVPQALGLCEDSSVIGAQFMVMTYVPGEVISNANQTTELTPSECDTISANLVSTLAKLHQLDPQDAGLETLGKPTGYLERQVSRWGNQWALSKTREQADVDALHTWLTTSIVALPNDRPTSLVHGDYRIDNVLLDPNTFEVQAVLDWEMATLGDPISDLAISLVYWSSRTDNLRTLVPVAEHITEAPGFWTREQIASNYASRTGFSLEHLDFCVVLACFKLAVIMESIHKRNQAGQQLGAASGPSSSMGRATGALAKLGLATIGEGTFSALNS